MRGTSWLMRNSPTKKWQDADVLPPTLVLLLAEPFEKKSYTRCLLMLVLSPIHSPAPDLSSCRAPRRSNVLSLSTPPETNTLSCSVFFKSFGRSLGLIRISVRARLFAFCFLLTASPALEMPPLSNPQAVGVTWTAIAYQNSSAADRNLCPSAHPLL